MKVFKYDSELDKAELLDEFRTFECFRKVERRVIKGPGDSTGRKKLYNTLELSYIYFKGYFDSRFQLYEEEEATEKIKKVLNLPEDWEADELVLECIEVYEDMQKTEAYENWRSLHNMVKGQAKYINTISEQMVDGTLNLREAKDFQQFVKGTNDNVRLLKDAKRLLVEEHGKKLVGKGGRSLNIFETSPPEFVHSIDGNKYVD